jgi:hypothetical protein
VSQPGRQSPVHGFSRLYDALWLAGIALASSSGVFSLRELGATFDEPIYLRLGLERWHSAEVNPHAALLTKLLRSFSAHDFRKVSGKDRD